MRQLLMSRFLHLCRYAIVAAICPWLDCGVAPSMEAPVSCPAGPLRSLDCGVEQTPPPIPRSCDGDCAALDGLSAASALAGTTNLTADELLSRYPVRFLSTLGYDPLSATNLDLIAKTELALSAEETGTLQKNGFLISAHGKFPNFVYGYQTLYLHDLPVFVSADSIMHAVHRSYDSILESIEESYLSGELTALLSSARAQLAGSAASGFSAAAIADADVYLTTALSLLADQLQPPIAGGSAAAVATLYDLAQAASGPSSVSLFGQSLTIDFSQFNPRGHYTDTLQLMHYFRCLMWLGQVPLPLTAYDNNQVLLLSRRPLEVAYLLTRLQDARSQQHYQSLDAVLRLFVGEPDSMTPGQLTSLMASLAVTTPADLAALPDGPILASLQSTRFGVQHVVSQLLERGTGKTAPPSPVFRLLGQRFVPDTQVLSNVVYDRAGSGKVNRFLPSPLDVAFAALHNNQAAQLLQPELSRYAYAPDLAAQRVLLDGYGADYWQSNLYTGWLGALRELAPSAVNSSPDAYGLPTVAGTEAWGRRLLNTQLASWAELRHDTVLYAKPSYSSATCEFPDAYVDPYPRFYAAVAALADRGAAGLRALPAAAPVISQAAEYFDGLRQVAGMLEEMAEFQRARRPFTAAHMAFINELVQVQKGCTGFRTAGWYLKLFWDPKEADRDPYPIADVATDPNTGTVLHVGTGMPRFTVVTAETCKGVRAYFGLASAYYEVSTSNFQRLNDMAWAELLSEKPPAEVPWLRDLH